MHYKSELRNFRISVSNTVLAPNLHIVIILKRKQTNYQIKHLSLILNILPIPKNNSILGKNNGASENAPENAKLPDDATMLSSASL